MSVKAAKRYREPIDSRHSAARRQKSAAKSCAATLAQAWRGASRKRRAPRAPACYLAEGDARPIGRCAGELLVLRACARASRRLIAISRNFARYVACARALASRRRCRRRRPASASRQASTPRSIIGENQRGAINRALCGSQHLPFAPREHLEGPTYGEKQSPSSDYIAARAFFYRP